MKNLINKFSNFATTERIRITRSSFIILFLFTACLSSCATSGPTAVIPPEYKPWDYLTNLNRETPGYAMYTYVLFNRKTTFLEKISPDIAEIYLSLLKAIEKPSASTDSPDIRADERNIFYIPSISAKEERILSLDNYNINLSLSYISKFISVMKIEYELAEHFATDTGPFLVSLFSPLQHSVNTSQVYKNDFPLFFVDLSKMPPSSINDIVEKYKRLLITKSDTGMRTLSILQSSLSGLFPAYDSEFKILKASAEFR